MDDEKMIPTMGRDKIPRALSFAIGAREISETLADVPQFNLSKLWFSADVSRALREQRYPSPIFQIRYFERSQSCLATRFLDQEQDEVWMIKIGVCRREDAAFVRDYLWETGLPAARKWLCGNAEVRGEISIREFRIEWEEIGRKFSVRTIQKN